MPPLCSNFPDDLRFDEQILTAIVIMAVFLQADRKGLAVRGTPLRFEKNTKRAGE